MKNQIYSLILARLPFLHLIASKDPFRDAMQYVQIKTFNEPGIYGPAGIYATATDAYTLAYFNLAEHLSNLENIPGPEILIKADQYKKLTGPKVYFIDFATPGQIISRDKAGQQIDAVPYLTAQDGPRYPEWPNILPTMEPEPAPLIGLHPEKLTTLCDVMNRGPLIFEFRGARRAIVARYLKPDESGTGYALVMPLMINDEEEPIKDRQEAQERNAKTYEAAKERQEQQEPSR
jgi:hypothetical protein